MIVGVLVFGLACACGGAKLESDHRDAQLLTQERAMADAFEQRARQLRQSADDISRELNDLRVQHAGERIDFKRKLQEAKNAKQLGKCESVPAANGQPASTVQYVNAGLWNDALKVQPDGPGGNPGRADAGAGGTGFATLDDAYDNLEENGARWQHCRDQVRKWKALAIKNGWVTPQQATPPPKNRLLDFFRGTPR